MKKSDISATFFKFPGSTGILLPKKKDGSVCRPLRLPGVAKVGEEAGVLGLAVEIVLQLAVGRGIGFAVDAEPLGGLVTTVAKVLSHLILFLRAGELVVLLSLTGKGLAGTVEVTEMGVAILMEFTTRGRNRPCKFSYF